MINWLFLLVSALLIPVMMIFFGKYMGKKAPDKINMVFGYRTARSMKNEATWKFAHNHFGRLWFINGLWLCAVTVLAMVCLFFFRNNEDLVGNCTVGVMFVQMVVMIIPIFFTERALKKKFDEEGNLIAKE